MKFLLGITPGGQISYCSKVYGGKSSDKDIFLQSGLLDKVTPGDAIMVDKGFLINQECLDKGIELIRPVFASQNEQFSREDALKTVAISSARVHVERVIQRIKLWKILKYKI